MTYSREHTTRYGVKLIMTLENPMNVTLTFKSQEDLDMYLMLENVERDDRIKLEVKP